MAGEEIRPGTPVEGVLPATGQRVVGFLRGPHAYNRSNSLWVVDGERWNGDHEKMPKRQYLVTDIRPVEGKELEDIVFNDLATQVLNGAITRDDAIKQVVKSKKISRAKAEAGLDPAIAEAKAALKAASKAPAGAKPKAAPAGAKEKAEPQRFADLRDELGLTNKQCAAANAEAGLGSTLSRITELTHSKGASVDTFAKVEAAWRAWAAAHKDEVGQ